MATYIYDPSTQTTGIDPFGNGWTLREGGGYVSAIAENASPVGSKVWEYTYNGGWTKVLFDAVPDTTGDVQILSLWKGGNNSHPHGHVHRFTDTGLFYGYFWGCRNNNAQVRGRRFDGGTNSSNGRTDLSAANHNIVREIDKWYWVKTESVGTTHRVKFWEYGTPEPASWTLEQVDANVATGKVGFGDFTGTQLHELAWFSVGTGGDAAPLPGGSTTFDVVTNPSDHAHTADNTELTTSLVSATNSADHGVSSDNITLQTSVTLSVNDSTHSLSSDQVELAPPADTFFEFNFGTDILDGSSPFEVFKDNGGAISPYVFTVQEDGTAVGGDSVKVSATSNSDNVRWAAKLKESILPQSSDQEILVRAKILINGNGALEILFRSDFDDVENDLEGYRVALSTSGGASDPLDADTLEIRLRRLKPGGADILNNAGANIDQDYAEWFWVRVQAQGTALRVKAWNSTDVEPASWTIDTIDNIAGTPIAGPGFVMVSGMHPTAYSASTYPDITTLDYFAVETDSDAWPIPLPSVGGENLVTAGTEHALNSDNVTLQTEVFLSTAASDHSVTSDAVVLSTNVSLVTQNSTHSLSSDVPGLTTASILGTNDSTHAQAAEAISLEYSATLATDGAAHGVSSDEVLISAQSSLTISGPSHTTVSDQVPIFSGLSLNPETAQHDHTADLISISSDSYLGTNAAVHALQAEELSLSAIMTLVTNDSSHGVVSDQIEFTTEGALNTNDATHGHVSETLGLVTSSNLGVEGAQHGTSSDQVTLSVAVTLTVASGQHALTSDELSLFSGLSVAPAAAVHNHIAEQLALSTQVALGTDGSTHSTEDSGLILAATFNLILNGALHGMSSEQVALTADNVALLETADSIHSQVADNLSLSTQVLINTGNAVHSLVSDAVQLYSNVFLATNESAHTVVSDELGVATGFLLDIAEAFHAMAADGVSLDTALSLAINNALSNHTAEQKVLTSLVNLLIEDAISTLQDSGLRMFFAVPLEIELRRSIFIKLSQQKPVARINGVNDVFVRIDSEGGVFLQAP